MWSANNYDISMAEGDWGITLPVTISGITVSANDEMVLTIKTAKNGSTVIEKTFSDITQNTISLELTQAESSLLSVGKYVYSLDWYQDGAFMCNLIPVSNFKVVDKA